MEKVKKYVCSLCGKPMIQGTRCWNHKDFKDYDVCKTVWAESHPDPNDDSKYLSDRQPIEAIEVSDPKEVYTCRQVTIWKH